MACRPPWVCVLPLILWWLNSSSASFISSDALGISHCQTSGEIEGKSVKLHAWLRIRSPVDGRRGHLASDATVAIHVKGYALLVEGSSASVPKPSEKLVQLKNSDVLASWAPKLWLRSSASGSRYPLEVRTRPAQPSAVIDVWATLDLPREDARLRAWELEVEGFPWVCWLAHQAPALATAWKPAPASQGDTLTRLRQLQRKRVKQPQVVFFLAHYFEVAADEYGTLLWHHLTWHRKLGISRYLLYVNRHLAPLLQNSLIQDLQRQGVLQVVLFVDLPRHVSSSSDHRVLYIDDYLLQTVINNHALLALWGTHHLLLIADLDEFIITHKPMSINRVFKECAPASDKPIGALRITRDNAVCAPSVPVAMCSNDKSYWSTWMKAPALEVAAGEVAHPMSYVVPQGRLDPGFHKLLLLPDLTMSTQVHSVSARPGAAQADADTACVRLLHLYNLHTWRPIEATYRLRMGMDVIQQWMWPLYAPYNTSSAPV